MGTPIARLGDQGSHGGPLVTSASKTYCQGILVCRVGDTYDCHVHGPNPIVSGSPEYIVEGQQCARIGSLTQCGATIVTGADESICQ
jgi:uncharacterized Zn-binding protein involved in type VI secretion